MYASSLWTCPSCSREILSMPGLQPRRCNKCKTPGDDLVYRGGRWNYKEERNAKDDSDRGKLHYGPAPPAPDKLT